MKTVYTLYRVSTVKQVDVTKDDIPMQRIACRDFAERQGWMIAKEFEEKGVSGFKVSAEKRDAIQDLKDAALKNEFDILLVFMFDRLGRIENETPFVLQWFAQHGVEVWSVNEGQQKFENHVDKLMNYIRFWQASGESEKTSIRVKTRLGQMTEEGLYTGGAVPFGYTLVDKGRKNKKGQPMRDFAIDPHEAEGVRRAFRMMAHEGYGSYQIAEWLNGEGYHTHGGARFQSTNVLRILRNPMIVGVVVNGDTHSKPIEELRIVSDEEFLSVQQILDERAHRSDEKRTVAMTNKGRALLSGNVFCAHCGCRLATSRNVENYRYRDGRERHTEFVRYVCYHRSRGLNDCDGASVYNGERVDRMVETVMRRMFAHVTDCPEEEKIQATFQNLIASNRQEQQRLEASLKKDAKQQEKLRNEIGKALTGDSIYSEEDLATALQSLRERMEESETRLAELKAEESEKKTLTDSIIPAYRQFKGWAEEFDSASLETKKMIAGKLFNRVEIGKSYQIRITLNMTYRQFLENWNENSAVEITA